MLNNQIIRVNGQPRFTEVSQPVAFFDRARGLIGSSSISANGAVWFDDCSFIHMFGMSFSIDVIFLDAGNSVIKIVKCLKPWRIAYAAGARRVIEVASGACDAHNICVGDNFKLDRKGDLS